MRNKAVSPLIVSKASICNVFQGDDQSVAAEYGIYMHEGAPRRAGLLIENVHGERGARRWTQSHSPKRNIGSALYVDSYSENLESELSCVAPLPPGNRELLRPRQAQT